MNIHPELLILNKLDALLKDNKDKGSISLKEMQNLKDEILSMVDQQVNFSKMYIMSASKYIDAKAKFEG